MVNILFRGGVGEARVSLNFSACLSRKCEAPATDAFRERETRAHAAMHDSGIGPGSACRGEPTRERVHRSALVRLTTSVGVSLEPVRERRSSLDELARVTAARL